jgi:hypothetical protein
MNDTESTATTSLATARSAEPVSSERPTNQADRSIIVSARESDMRQNVRNGTPRFHSHSAASVSYRLHQQFGESPQTWEQRLSQDFKRMALMIGTMRAMGAEDLLTEKMMPVELALGPTGNVPLPDALHLAEVADCVEQMADETFRFKLVQGTATVADGKEYLRKSALQCARAEVARRELAEWITEQEAAR